MSVQASKLITGTDTNTLLPWQLINVITWRTRCLDFYKWETGKGVFQTTGDNDTLLKIVFSSLFDFSYPIWRHQRWNFLEFNSGPTETEQWIERSWTKEVDVSLLPLRLGNQNNTSNLLCYFCLHFRGTLDDMFGVYNNNDKKYSSTVHYVCALIIS